MVYRVLDADGAGTTAVPRDTGYYWEATEAAATCRGIKAEGGSGKQHLPFMNLHTDAQWHEASHIFVYGPQTDLVLFDVTGKSMGGGLYSFNLDSVYALLGDHLNTVRDMASLVVDGGTLTPTHQNHLQFDSFGRLIDRPKKVGPKKVAGTVQVIHI
jgi:hypothetical protein